MSVGSASKADLSTPKFLARTSRGVCANQSQIRNVSELVRFRFHFLLKILQNDIFKILLCLYDSGEYRLRIVWRLFR
jgi:hypothetical protein